ncbi:nucleoside/nucleotide kinase family protein [Flindersiella endophytica]
MRSILITGVRGVGKTTITTRVAEQLGMRSYDYADLMLKADPDLTDKDSIEAIDWIRRQTIYRQIDAVLDNWFGAGNTDPTCLLMENHLSIVQDGNITTFPARSWRLYNPIGIAVIEASPETIRRRRLDDRSRRRTQDSDDRIAEQQAVNEEGACEIAAVLGIPAITIDNDDEQRASANLAAWIGTFRR